MKIEKFHHVAYRCKDAKQTVEWYAKHLKMNFVLAIAEDRVPSTHAPDHARFMQAGAKAVLVKPFAPHALQTQLARVLTQPVSG